ncbi:ionotropic receptor 93a isoform X2 [Procambarus clarkii]|uniref:ionotropic receptor 93a isoform X2 n=1 Tax=Procambarus clarkii TaxID=6728 RepID=UPI003743132F
MQGQRAGRSRVWVWRCLAAVTILVSTHAQLDYEDSTLGVYLESGMLQGLRFQTQELVKAAVKEGSAAMTLGSLSVQFLASMNDTLPDNTTAVLTMVSCTNTHAWADRLVQNGTLHIALTESGCPRITSSTAITVPLIKGSRDIVQVFRDLRDKDTLIWRDIVLIHDNSIDQLELNDIVTLLMETAPGTPVTPENQKTSGTQESSITIIDMATPEASSMKLGKLFSSLRPRAGEPREKHFLVIAFKDQISSIQDLARSMKLFGIKNQWLFVVPDSHSLKYDMYGYLNTMQDGDNLAFVYNMSQLSPVTPCNDGFECYMELLIKQYATELSSALTKELELYNQVSEEEWGEMKPSPASRSATIVSMIKEKQKENQTCSRCTRWGVQAAEVKDADRFELLSVADWRPLTGLRFFDDLFPHVTGNFRGRTIPVTSVHFPPWQVFVKDRSGQVAHYEGLIFEVLNQLASKLNFSYVVRVPADNQWGVADKNGNWNGMVKLIQNGEVVLGAAAFTVSEKRMQAVNFTTTIDRQPYAFMISRPKELSRVLLFMEPFANDTWTYLIISMIAISPILYLINRYSPYYTYYGLYNGRGLFQLHNCFWYVYSAVLQQGCDWDPMSDSGRLVVGTWWIFVLLVVTLYSGNLVAYLTFPKVENPVNTLDDLLSLRATVTWGYFRGTVLENYFQDATGKFALVGRYAEKHDEAKQAQLLDRIRTTDHALLGWKTTLLFLMRDQFLATNTCDFSLGTEEFYDENVALAVPQGSPFLDKFNAELKRMQVGGLIQKWKMDYWPRKDRCSVTAQGGGDDATRTVSLADMQGSFVLLFLGFLLAAIFIVVECVYKGWKDKSKPDAKNQ